MVIGMHVGIASFSSQPELIQSVVDIVIEGEASKEVVVRSGLRTCEGAQGLDEIPQDVLDRFASHGTGKQLHIASIVHAIESREKGIKLSPSAVLLIDDDDNNVKQANRNGMSAVRFNPDTPHSLYTETPTDALGPGAR